MAKLVLKDAFLEIDGVDHSANASTVELSLEADEQDATTFDSEGWTENLQGLKSGSLSVTFKSDFTAGGLDELLWDIFDTGDNVPFEVRMRQSSVSTDNPSYTGQIMPSGHTVGGEVGNIAENEVEFPTSGRVQRATA